MRHLIRYLPCVMAVASGVLAIGSSGTAAGQNFAVSPRLYVRPGDVAYVDVMADDLIRGLGGVNLSLNYREKSPATAPPITAAIKDPNNASEIKLGTMVPTPLLAVDIRDEEIGVAVVCLSDKLAGYGPGLVVSIPLQVPKDAPPGAVYGLFLTKHLAIGPQNERLPTTATPGLLHVDLSPPIPGDLNGDGKVDINDAVIALRIAAKRLDPTDRQLYAGDLPPRQNRITVVDVVKILRLAVGIPI